MATTPALDRASILNQAYRLLNQKDFSKESSSKVENLLALADAIDGAEARFARMRIDAARQECGLPRDSELIRFLRKQTRADVDGGIATYRESRDMDTGTGAGTFGSPLAAPLFRDRVINAMRAYDGLYDAATWVPTATGAKFSMPSADDTAVSAVQVSQGTQNSVQEFTSISATNFDQPPLWRTGNLKVSIELLQDSGIDLEQFFADRFAVRFARGLGATLVASVKSGATVGAIAQGDSNASSPDGTSEIGYPDLIALIDSLDSAYSEAPGAGFLMRRGTLNKIANLTDRDGRPLHLIRFEDGQYYLLGWRVRISPSMDAIGANALTVAFGDLSRVYVRHQENTFSIRRSDERFADYAQVLFQGFWRLDGKYAPAGAGSDSPIVLLKMAAS